MSNPLPHLSGPAQDDAADSAHDTHGAEEDHHGLLDAFDLHASAEERRARRRAAEAEVDVVGA